MAHSDALIFLNTITWVFFLFLSIYFFFVLFFLPTFYKKVRIRTLVREFYIREVFSEFFDSLSTASVFFESFKSFVSSFLGLIGYRLTSVFFTRLDSFSVLSFFLKSSGLEGTKSSVVFKKFFLSTSLGFFVVDAPKGGVYHK